MKAYKKIIPVAVFSAAFLQSVMAVDWTSALYWTNYGINAGSNGAITNGADDYKAFSYWDSSAGKPYDATVPSGTTINSSTNLVFNQSYVKAGTKNNYINTSAVITSGDVLFEDFSVNFQFHGGSGSGVWTMNSLTVNNPAVATIQFDQGSDYGGLALDVKGNLSVTGGNTSAQLLNFSLGGQVSISSGSDVPTSKGLRSLHIGGDLELSGRTFVFINTLDKTCSGQTFTRENYLSPTTVIDGIISMSVVDGGVPMLVLSRRNYSVYATSITSVGGISGVSGTLKAGARNDAGTTALVFRNDTPLQTFTGAVQDGDSANMSMYLVMMGTAGSVQKLTGYTNSFSAGIEIISGTLAVYNTVNSGDILMYSDTSGDGSNTGKLWITKSARNDVPVLKAESIYWKSGTIVVENTSAGSSMITLNGGMYDDGIVDGGLCFEFNSDLFALDGDSEFHLVSWDNVTNQTTLSASDFTATGTLINDIRGMYNHNFSIRDDGLWISFAFVPEPSTYAAIFGVGALLFAYLRRRR